MSHYVTFFSAPGKDPRVHCFRPENESRRPWARQSSAPMGLELETPKAETVAAIGTAEFGKALLEEITATAKFEFIEEKLKEFEKYLSLQMPNGFCLLPVVSYHYYYLGRHNSSKGVATDIHAFVNMGNTHLRSVVYNGKTYLRSVNIGAGLSAKQTSYPFRSVLAKFRQQVLMRE